MKRKIVYGVCGIGLGHTVRQLPILDTLSREHRILLFAYGESLSFLQKRYRDNPRVGICEVAVPFVAGSDAGLDFVASAERARDASMNYTERNFSAMARAAEEIGVPDLVISDYEPVAAQYGYACGAPVVTIDQQSKFLLMDAEKRLGGISCRDEQMRLRMFFPKADLRIACSFFRVVPETAALESVEIVPTVLRENIVGGRMAYDVSGALVVYFTAQRALTQSLAEVLEILGAFGSIPFDLFAPGEIGSVPENVTVWRYGSDHFIERLRRSSGVISTAGHGVLSEAMYLGIPVYAMPLPLYEQLINAETIARCGFGISQSRLTRDDLSRFLELRSDAAETIARDTEILLRRDGSVKILELLESRYL
jgi:uncharacterized protein (TIGR00661 family)